MIDEDGFERHSEEEEVHLTNNAVTSCEVIVDELSEDVCKSCTVCGDNKSLAIDWSEQLGYTIECDEEYTGSSGAHTFVFKDISPPSTKSTVTSTTTESNINCKATEALETETKCNAGTTNIRFPSSLRLDCGLRLEMVLIWAATMHVNEDS